MRISLTGKKSLGKALALAQTGLAAARGDRKAQEQLLIGSAKAVVSQVAKRKKKKSTASASGPARLGIPDGGLHIETPSVRATNKGRVEVRGEELFTTIVSLTGATSYLGVEQYSYPVQPLSGSFPMLAETARLYQKYRVLMMEFDYRPSVPTTSAGQIGICFIRDPMDAAPTDLTNLMRLPGSVIVPVASSTTMRVLPRTEELYLDQMNGGIAEIRLADFGTLGIVAEGITAFDGTPIAPNIPRGRLTVRYVVEFINLRTNPENLTSLQTSFVVPAGIVPATALIPQYYQRERSTIGRFWRPGVRGGVAVLVYGGASRWYDASVQLNIAVDQNIDLASVTMYGPDGNPVPVRDVVGSRFTLTGYANDVCKTVQGEVYMAQGAYVALEGTPFIGDLNVTIDLQ